MKWQPVACLKPLFNPFKNQTTIIRCRCVHAFWVLPFLNPALRHTDTICSPVPCTQAHRHNLVTCTLHSGIQTQSTHLYLALGHTDTISSPVPSKLPKCSYWSNSYIMKRNQKQTGGFLAGSDHANRTRGWYTLPDTSTVQFSEARHLYWAFQWSQTPLLGGSVKLVCTVKALCNLSCKKLRKVAADFWVGIGSCCV